MGQARHHCEQAFEAYLRRRRAPLVSVNESRKSLLPATLQGGKAGAAGALHDAAEGGLKSFDYILYGADVNLLVEIKGRRLPRGGRAGAGGTGVRGMGAAGMGAGGMGGEVMQNWVTAGDIASLRCWESLFGPGFCAAIVFMYWSDRVIGPAPPLVGAVGARAEERFEHHGRWYLLRVIGAADYQRHMRPRSARWDTMHLPAATFDRLSRPLLAPPAPPAPRIARRLPISTSRIPPVAGAA